MSKPSQLSDVAGVNAIKQTCLVPRGGTLIFSAYVGSDPAYNVHSKKNIRNFKHPKKIFEILATQKNIPILYLDLKKDPKLHRNVPQTSPNL